MRTLEGLFPEKVMFYFEEISNIPRNSLHEEKIAEYIQNFAESRHMECIRDEINNVLIKKPASAGYEDCETLILQAHLDMICVKEPDYPHDFENDGLDLYVENGRIMARGTTLGADDGIGVAYGLAILDSDTLKHPPLEVVFTVAEEIGMVGAQHFDMKKLSGKYMINFDAGGFTEGRIYVGCAGNSKITLTQKLAYEPGKSGCQYRISLKGLKGGHSGGEIAKGRGNATVLMGRLLQKLSQSADLDISHVQSGDPIGSNKHGIPDMFTVDVIAAQYENVSEPAAEFYEEIKNELQVIEENMSLSIEKLDVSSIFVLDKKTVTDMVDTLLLLPNGVYSMDKHFVDIPECSNNIGNLEIDEESGTLVYNLSVRSSKKSLLDFIAAKIKRIAELKGLNFTQGPYLPGWDYEDDSSLKNLIETEYIRMYGSNPRFKITHASTECGLFKEQIKDLEIISMGPIIYEEHTVNEYMGIDSVNVLWTFLCNILEKCIILPKRGI